VRRRQAAETTVPEPPAELLEYDEARWLPLVDPAAYRVDDHRQRYEGRAIGPARLSFNDWTRGEARRLWLRQRIAWCRAHGWPGGATPLDLYREEARARRCGLR
jgi:hypothetical protein